MISIALNNILLNIEFYSKYRNKIYISCNVENCKNTIIPQNPSVEAKEKTSGFK